MWVDAFYNNWNVVSKNPFGHSIKTQPSHETLFDLRVKIAIKGQ